MTRAGTSRKRLLDSARWHCASYGQDNSAYAEGIFKKQDNFEGIMAIQIPGSDIPWLLKNACSKTIEEAYN
jgi:hypothetical protein